MSTQIQEILQTMRVAYVKNLPQQLDAIESLAMDYHRNPGDTASQEALQRALHSLKGTAGTYGITVISAICQTFEDQLEQPAGNTQNTHMDERQINVLLELLRVAQQAAEAGAESFPRIEAALAGIRNGTPD